MGVLGSVVAPSTALMSFCNSKIMDCGNIRFEIVRDELVWHKTVFLQKLAHEFQRRPFVPLALDQNIQHFTLGVDKVSIVRAGFGIPVTVSQSGTGANNFGTEYFVPDVGPTRGHGQFLFDNVLHQLLWDADGTGAGGTTLIATFSVNLTANDFHLV